MIYLQFFGVILSGILLASIVVIVYVKLLSVLIPKVFKGVCNHRANSRNNSGIEVALINCFDKAYYFSYSCISHIGGVIKSYIGHKHINEYCHNASYNSDKESYDKNSKCLTHWCHADTLSQRKQGGQPKGNDTLLTF